MSSQNVNVLGEVKGTPFGRNAWDSLSQEFLACHRKAENVALHLFTTPLGLFACIALLHHFSPLLSALAAAIYVLTLAGRIPDNLWRVTLVSVGATYVLVSLLPVGPIFSLALLVGAYFLQDMAHTLAGEPTLQSQYAGKENWFTKFFEHTFYLLPLVFSSFWRSHGSLFAFAVPKRRVLMARLEDSHYVPAMDRVVEFIEAENPSREHTYHRWQNELDGQVGQAFAELASAEPIMTMFRERHGKNCEIEILTGMNELYVAGPMKKLTSDSVFKTPHIDGPWAVYPFASVYRCLIAVSENKRVTTHFPMNGATYDEPLSYRIERGEACAFDYNREPHYITINRDIPQTNRRVTLKVHYLVYPKWWRPLGQLLGRLTVRYNDRARQLFLNTINPNSFIVKAKAWMVLASTILFESTERFIGFGNLAFVASMGLIAAVSGSPAFFLLTTGFVHYLIYIGAYAVRDQIAFGKLKRDAIFYKNLSLCSLLAVALNPFAPTFLSVSCLIVGLFISTLAWMRLGTNRTYFGYELGWSSRLEVADFPYGTIPHPMILGSMLAIVGIGLMPTMTGIYTWIIGAHLFFYALHLLQEVYDTQPRLEEGNSRLQSKLASGAQV